MSAAIRPLTREGLVDASALCLRSKAHWGYDADFMAACRDALTLRPEDLVGDLAVGLSEGGQLRGVAHISRAGEEWELDKLFIDPRALRRGLGRALFAWAVSAVAARGGKSLVIAADPDAAAFYRRMGAKDAGQVPSGSIPGRRLPLLRYPITCVS